MNEDAEPHKEPELRDDDLASVEQIHQAYQRITTEMSQIIVGQDTVIRQLLVSLFAGGHCLLVGVPGLAKTLMIRTLANALNLKFNRIQFTPDLMPSDITGTEVIYEDKASGERNFRFIRGPVFANVLLADEINRTPPKTQAALLEAMQERQVTVGGERHQIGEPFFVLATQNPIEHEGTYPLPEAQLDRFMFQVLVDYPSESEELDIVLQTTSAEVSEPGAIMSADELLELKRVVRRVPIAEHLALHAMRLARRSRPSLDESPTFIREYVTWGAGPRASQYLVLGAKAHAVMQGRCFVTPDDIHAVAAPVLRHRIRLNFAADADGLTSDELIVKLIEDTPLLEEKKTRGFIPNVLRSAASRDR